MSRKVPVYHATEHTHVNKRKGPAPKGPYSWSVREHTLCGYEVGHFYWRRKEVLAAKYCARTVTCKQCLNRVAFKKANPNIKPKEVSIGAASPIRST